MFVRVVMTLILVLNLAVAVQAQDEAVRMDEIVVTATKTERQVKDVPTNVTVIPREDIEKYNAKDLSDLLQQVPGFNTSAFGGIHADIYVSSRGNQPTTRGAQLLVNGIEYNNIDGYFSVQNIPIGDIERIEILKSPTSSLYGNFGTGGVVNVITRKATEPYETTVGASYGSFNTFNSYAVLNGAQNNWEYYFEGRYLNTDGWQDNSWERNGLFHAHAKYNLNDSTAVGAHVNYMDLTNGYPGTLTKDQFKADPRQTNQPWGDADSYMLLMALFFEKSFGNSKLLAKVKYAGMDGYAIDPDYFDFGGYNIVPEVNYTIGHSLGEMNGTLLIGGEYRYLDYDKTRAYTYVNGHKDELYMDRSRKENTGAFFVQEELNVLKDWLVSAGVRYDYVQTDFTDHLNSNNDFDKSHSAWSPKVGTAYTFTDALTVFANYSQGFRNPSTASSGFASNPDLKPEIIRGYETGVRGQPTAWLFYNAALFLTDTDDKIVRTGASGRAVENAGETRSTGVELGLNAQFKSGFRGSFNYTYANSEYTDYTTAAGVSYDDKNIPLVPKHLLGVSVGYGSALLGQLDVMVNYGSKRWLDNANTKTIGSYTTLDAKYRYNLDKHWELFVAGTNLTDEEYVQVGFGGEGWEELYPMPGRSIAGGVNLRF
jgi:outer membrane receptor protein involved in Fe transport